MFVIQKAIKMAVHYIGLHCPGTQLEKRHQDGVKYFHFNVVNEKEKQISSELCFKMLQIQLERFWPLWNEFFVVASTGMCF